jgi:hypothetical protein
VRHARIPAVIPASNISRKAIACFVGHRTDCRLVRKRRQSVRRAAKGLDKADDYDGPDSNLFVFTRAELICRAERAAASEVSLLRSVPPCEGIRA